jgi:uncharacterized membrane protein
MVAAALIGVAVMAAVDEIVFHQVPGWHHFYDRATPAVGLLSDSLLHTAEPLALVAGLVMGADLRRRRALAAGHAWAGLFLGLGGFQLFDGLVGHKMLRAHQMPQGADPPPYGLAWNGAALLLLAIGALLACRAVRASRAVRAGGAVRAEAAAGVSGVSGGGISGVGGASRAGLGLRDAGRGGDAS